MPEDKDRITVNGDASLHDSTLQKTVHNNYFAGAQSGIVSAEVFALLRAEDRGFIAGAFAEAVRELRSVLEQNEDAELKDYLEDLSTELGEAAPKKTRVRAAWDFLSRNSEHIQELNGGADLVRKIDSGVEAIVGVL